VMRVVVGDLASRPADAIVRPATTRLEPTTPAIGRLDAAGGPEYLRHLTLQKELAVGAAVVTGGGGEIPAEFLIHAVISSATEPVSRGSVARAWLSTLQRAREWGFAHLTTPPLGTGAGNLALEAVADIMVGVFTAHLQQTDAPLDITFVVETDEDRGVFAAAVRRQSAELS